VNRCVLAQDERAEAYSRYVERANRANRPETATLGSCGPTGKVTGFEVAREHCRLPD
jgi:hypothetical protein